MPEHARSLRGEIIESFPIEQGTNHPAVRRRARLTWLVLAVVASSPLAMAQHRAGAQSEWTVAAGMELRTDAVGFEYPVGIALLHRPGPDPQDVRYIVTHLRGGISAVLNDARVVPIAVEEDTFEPEAELPWGAGESGQIGACMSADDTYLFTTGAVSMGWVRVNRITKWRTVGAPRWHRIERVAVFQEPLQHDPTSASHQIGHCKIDADGKLWVGVGDGNIPETTHLPNHANGKVLRMNPDFSAPRDNPYFDEAEPAGIASYVWSMGLRNPFALAHVHGVAHVADNGIAIDRLVRLVKGKDFPWDKTDASMTYDNLVTFPDGLGPADMVYVPHGHPLTSLNGHLVIVASHEAQLVAIPYDLEAGVKGSPWIVVEPAVQAGRVRDFAGAALAPDALYVSHIRIHGEDGPLPSEVFKLVPSGTVREKTIRSAAELIDEHACRGCHVVGGLGESAVGPNLDLVMDRVRARLGESAYRVRLVELQGRAGEPGHERWSRVRERILDERVSLDERVRLWVETKIVNPRFDDPSSAMPVPAMSEEDARKVTDYLVVSARGVATQPDSEPVGNRFRLMKRRMGRSPEVLLAFALVLGLVLGLALAGVIGRLRRRRQRPRRGAV